MLVSLPCLPIREGVDRFSGNRGRAGRGWSSARNVELASERVDRAPSDLCDEWAVPPCDRERSNTDDMDVLVFARGRLPIAPFGGDDGGAMVNGLRSAGYPPGRLSHDTLGMGGGGGRSAPLLNTFFNDANDPLRGPSSPLPDPDCCMACVPSEVADPFDCLPRRCTGVGGSSVARSCAEAENDSPLLPGVDCVRPNPNGRSGKLSARGVSSGELTVGVPRGERTKEGRLRSSSSSKSGY